MHSLLRQQIHTHVGESLTVQKEWRALLNAVDHAYREFERTRQVVDSALEISTQKLVRVHSEMRAVFQAFPDLIFKLSPAGMMMEYNAGEVTTDFPWAQERVLGRSLRAIFPSPTADQFEQGLRDACATRGPTTIEFSIPWRDRDASYEARLIPLLDEQIMVMVRDITRRKQVEADAVVAREAAEAANKAKSAFLANMSHEIRTPLTAIIGFAEAMLDNASTMAERDDAARTISRSGKHLLAIINQVLDLSKVEADRLEIELIPFSPFDVLTEIEALLTMHAQAKGLAFSIGHGFPLPRQIVSDPTRLKQILLNVASNAIKFTDQGSVTIAVTYEPSDPRIRFVVADTGIGLTPDQQRRIFAPFTQADPSTTRRYGGTGLGLYISRQMAERLGGSITVESESGVGSRFTVTIATGPIESVEWVRTASDLPKPQGRVVAPPPSDRLSGRVLLAEDSPDNQRLISLYLRRMGVSVTVVENGQAAVERALAEEFDIVFMDMQMPVMDGIEATGWLRRAGYARPIVALTANAMKSDRERCLAADCTDFLTKPIDRDAFGHMVARYLRPADPVVERSTIPSDIPDDDPEFQALVKRFLSDLPVLLADITAATEARRWAAVKSALHQLKGMGGSFGYPDLTDLASRIECVLAKQDFEEVSSLVHRLNIVCQRIHQPS